MVHRIGCTMLCTFSAKNGEIVAAAPPALNPLSASTVDLYVPTASVTLNQWSNPSPPVLRPPLDLLSPPPLAPLLQRGTSSFCYVRFGLVRFVKFRRHGSRVYSARQCVAQCRVQDLVGESRRLGADALLALLRALIAIVRTGLPRHERRRLDGSRGGCDGGDGGGSGGGGGRGGDCVGGGTERLGAVGRGEKEGAEAAAAAAAAAGVDGVERIEA